jgi:hypothetical protein
VIGHAEEWILYRPLAGEPFVVALAFFNPVGNWRPFLVIGKIFGQVLRRKFNFTRRGL